MIFKGGADDLGKLLLPGIQAAIFGAIEEEIKKQAETIARNAIEHACKLVVRQIVSMESMADRKVVLELYINMEKIAEFPCQ